MIEEWQAKLVQYETIAEVEHEKRTEQMTASGSPTEDEWGNELEPTPHPKEVVWQNLINFAFDDSAGNVAHWTTHRTPNQAPMARRVPRRRG